MLPIQDNLINKPQMTKLVRLKFYHQSHCLEHNLVHLMICFLWVLVGLLLMLKKISRDAWSVICTSHVGMCTSFEYLLVVALSNVPIWRVEEDLLNPVLVYLHMVLNPFIFQNMLRFWVWCEIHFSPLFFI